MNIYYYNYAPPLNVPPIAQPAMPPVQQPNALPIEYPPPLQGGSQHPIVQSPIVTEPEEAPVTYRRRRPNDTIPRGYSGWRGDSNGRGGSVPRRGSTRDAPVRRGVGSTRGARRGGGGRGGVRYLPAHAPRGFVPHRGGRGGGGGRGGVGNLPAHPPRGSEPYQGARGRGDGRGGVRYHPTHASGAQNDMDRVRGEVSLPLPGPRPLAQSTPVRHMEEQPATDRGTSPDRCVLPPVLPLPINSNQVESNRDQHEQNDSSFFSLNYRIRDSSIDDSGYTSSLGYIAGNSGSVVSDDGDSLHSVEVAADNGGFTGPPLVNYSDSEGGEDDTQDNDRWEDYVNPLGQPIDLVVRFPDGGRRLLNLTTSTLFKCVSWFVRGSGYSLSTHRMIRQYPEREFGKAQRETSLGDLGFSRRDIIFVRSH